MVETTVKIQALWNFVLSVRRQHTLHLLSLGAGGRGKQRMLGVYRRVWEWRGKRLRALWSFNNRRTNRTNITSVDRNIKRQSYVKPGWKWNLQQKRRVVFASPFTFEFFCHKVRKTFSKLSSRSFEESWSFATTSSCLGSSLPSGNSNHPAPPSVRISSRDSGHSRPWELSIPTDLSVNYFVDTTDWPFCKRSFLSTPIAKYSRLVLTKRVEKSRAEYVVMYVSDYSVHEVISMYSLTKSWFCSSVANFIFSYWAFQ